MKIKDKLEGTIYEGDHLDTEYSDGAKIVKMDIKSAGSIEFNKPVKHQFTFDENGYYEMIEE